MLSQFQPRKQEPHQAEAFFNRWQDSEAEVLSITHHI